MKSYGYTVYAKDCVFATLGYEGDATALTLSGTVFMDRCTDAGIDALAQWMKDYVAECRAARQKDAAEA